MLSQHAAVEADKLYGPDPLLYNGKKYTYFLPPGTGGHQFFTSPDYFIGSVSIKDRTFDDLTLNYDIFNQQLLLQYATANGAFNIIEVSKAWLEGFTLGSMHFQYLDLEGTPQFYQVIGENNVKILYRWKKDLKLDIGATSGNFTFTPAIRSAFVMMDGNLYPYRSKRSLVKLFDPAKRSEIKNYIRKNRISIKKASDSTMAGLINFIDNL